MRKAILDEMRAVLDPPVYVYRKSLTGYFCDKLTLHEDAKSWIRRRYFMTAGTSCTCLGYVKFKKCKHLTMLSDEGDWPVSGVPGGVAIAETERLIQLLSPKFPKSSGPWKPDLDLVPEYVTVIKLGVLVEEAPDTFERVTSIRKCGEAGTVGILLKVLEKSEK